MKKYCGYYSLIQYCPDRSLMEMASIGLLLFCPDMNYINVRPTSNNRRIEKIFCKRSSNESFLQDYKECLASHFRDEFANEVSYESINWYLREKFVNDICFTEIRTVLVSKNPEKDLEELFYKIFRDTEEPIGKQKRRPRYEPRKRILKTLREQDQSMLEKIAVPGRVSVSEDKNLSINTDFAFLNENVNFVISKRVNAANAPKQTGDTIVAGQFISKKRFDWGKSKVTVLADIDDDSDRNYINPYIDLLKDNGIGFFEKEDDLIGYIIAHARELPAELKPYSIDKQRNLDLDA